MQQHASTYSALSHALDPLGGTKCQKYCFSESSHITFQSNGTKHHTSTHSVLTQTLHPWGGIKRSKHIFSESSHGAYQIKGNIT